jgi:hypothetical protein
MVVDKKGGKDGGKTGSEVDEEGGKLYEGVDELVDGRRSQLKRKKGRPRRGRRSQSSQQERLQRRTAHLHCTTHNRAKNEGFARSVLEQTPVKRPFFFGDSGLAPTRDHRLRNTAHGNLISKGSFNRSVTLPSLSFHFFNTAQLRPLGQSIYSRCCPEL